MYEGTSSDNFRSDQFCSLVFTLSNLFFVACAYSEGLDADWRKCTSEHKLWGIPFLLAALPLLVRTVQSVKRWFDSRLVTHLINVSIFAARSRPICKSSNFDMNRVASMPWASCTTSSISIGDITAGIEVGLSPSGFYLPPFIRPTPHHG